jgi:hypothetical protein
VCGSAPVRPSRQRASAPIHPILLICPPARAPARAPLHACARTPSIDRPSGFGAAESEWAPQGETHTGADNSQLWTLQGCRTVENNIPHTSVLAGRSAPSSTFIPVAFCSAASLSGVPCNIRRTVSCAQYKLCRHVTGTGTSQARYRHWHFAGTLQARFKL